jgi:hypothetical protein
MWEPGEHGSGYSKEGGREALRRKEGRLILVGGALQDLPLRDAKSVGQGNTSVSHREP